MDLASEAARLRAAATAGPLKLPVNRRIDERHHVVTDDGLGVWFTVQLSPHARILEAVFERVSRDRIYAVTGIQFLPINTLYQLYAMRLMGSPALSNAHTLLMTPDLFNYWLTGVAKSERTIASTSQCYNPRLGRWATELFDQLGLPKAILPEIVCPGTRLGSLLPAVAEAGAPSKDTDRLLEADSSAAKPASGF